MTSMRQDPAQGSIVVGVDASEHGRRALTVAVDLARRLHVPCHVLHVWAYPTMAIAGPYAGGAWPLIDLGPAETTWLEQLLADVEHDGVTISAEVQRGAAGPALVAAAAALNSPLVIVGSVGHGAVLGALLGSVSGYCLHHAACPVVVVPPAGRVAPALPAERTPVAAHSQ